jgi:hypothetical protein
VLTRLRELLAEMSGTTVDDYSVLGKISSVDPAARV